MRLVVTGASSGIGREVARQALARGWQVAGLARRADRLDLPGLLALPCDVTLEREVTAAFAEIAARWGRIDVLFNNAGVFPKPALIDEITLPDWQAALDVNLTGMFFCARAAFAQMRGQSPQGGRIINNGSLAAQTPRPRALAYTVSKHAVTGLTKQLALDGRPFGITCGQIDIGNAATDLAAPISTGALQPDGTRRPEPMMDVADAASAVLHMAALPPGTNVLSLTIMASAMPFVGRG